MTAEERKQPKFEHTVARGVTLVEFNAPWCRPCRDQTPIIKALKKEFTNVAQIKIIDIDKHEETAIRLGIQSIPTIIIYKDGREMHRFIGVQSSDTLSRALKRLIN